MTATIEEVRSAFEEGTRVLFTLDQALAEERRFITLSALAESRELSAEEIARRREIGATRAELADGLEVLALDTLDRLENASDLDTLLLRIAAMNQGLKDDIELLKSVERHANLAEGALKGVATAARKLADLRPRFG